MDLELADGKYTIKSEGNSIVCLRYGEPWRDITGDNLIYWLLHEIELRDEKLAEPPFTAIARNLTIIGESLTMCELEINEQQTTIEKQQTTIEKQQTTIEKLRNQIDDY